MSKESKITRKEFLVKSAKITGYFTASLPLAIPGKIFLDDILGKDEPETVPNPPPTPEPDKSREETRPAPESPAQRESPAKVETGIDLLESMGLRDEVIYIVYGRPGGWGSLGLTQTAEGSWAFFHTRKESISQKIGLNEQDFALNIINPAYYSQEHEAYYALSDDYVKEILRLAPENQGLVALNFNRLDFAKAAISYLETILPKEQLAYLALGFDAEHFPNSRVDARALNQFVSWFAQKHQEWAEGKPIPGLVFVYIFPGSKILNMSELKQYYPNKKTLVVPIFDGWGSKEEKLSPMVGYIGTLPNSKASPAVLGVMETESRHPGRFGECSVKESWETLAGSPTKIFATQ